MSVQQQQRLSSGQNANKWKWIQLDVLKVKLFSTSVEGQFSKNSWRCKMGRRITRNCNSSLSSPPGPTGRAVLLPQLVNRLRVCWRAQCPVCSSVYLEMNLSTLSPSRNFMALQWILLQFSGCPRGPSSSWMYCSHRSLGKQNPPFKWRCVTCGTRNSRN